MRLLSLAVAAALLCPVAKADKFHLGSPETRAKLAEGSAPDVIEGVLLSEDAEFFHVRVVGGEVMLRKQLVTKVEKDDLTLDAIVKRERDRAEQLAKADAERRAAQAEARAAESAPDRRPRGTPAEATLRRPGAAVPVEAAFDPVVGVLEPAVTLSDRDLLREMELAYELTGDHRYIKLVRKLRRLR